MTAAKSVIIDADAAGLAAAAKALADGRLVAFPTETVYGLGADARNDHAVAAIFEAKGRPRFNPLIVHVRDLDTARIYGTFSQPALTLARAFWPGPLTLVVPQAPHASLSRLVSAGLDTVALRVPGHEVAQALLAAFDGPIAAPSANPSGRLSPTESEHVEEGLGDHVALILEAEACPLGLESTIMDLTGETPRLLRPGALVRKDIEQVLGRPVEGAGVKAAGTDAVQAPGQLASHYAPQAQLRLETSQCGEGEMLLAFGPNAPKGVPGLNLSPSGDLREAAANLFAYLHILDATGVAVINVMPIPDQGPGQGLGEAINDRLARAAAPRARPAAPPETSQPEDKTG